MLCVNTPSRKCIRLLPPHIANIIAAGEVVERPSSVLKELLENSIDAGARAIHIELINGGLSCIRVTDDGLGIPQEELALSLCRHATSKITTALDLEKIQSLGFRGEALASIASVSKLVIISKAIEQDKAYQCRVGEDGSTEILVAAHPQGTTLEIRDLFYNVPVRRKFLKSVKTEFERLDEVLKKMALSHYAIAFTLSHNQKKLRNYPSALTQEARLGRVQKIVGKPFMQTAFEIDFERNGLRLWGYLGSLESADRHAEHQYFFVNQRPIRDKVVTHAIKTAFHNQGLSLEALHPAYVLYLELDPSEVDVNVHPTKQEVRFAQARLIHDFINHTIVSVIEQRIGVLPVRASQEKSMACSAPVYFEEVHQIERDLTTNLLVFANYYILSLEDRLMIIDIERFDYQSLSIASKPLLHPIIVSKSNISPENRLILEKVGFKLIQNIKQEWIITHLPEQEGLLFFTPKDIAAWFKASRLE